MLFSPQFTRRADHRFSSFSVHRTSRLQSSNEFLMLEFEVRSVRCESDGDDSASAKAACGRSDSRKRSTATGFEPSASVQALVAAIRVRCRRRILLDNAAE